ncbi:MAG: PAS domain-containing protein, partial [Lentisphaeraceae bacterium]|nr:PAS domain-containing protein [Lentisphaeraceae bacterium]
MLRPELLERLIERLGQMDSQSIQGYFLRLVREKGVLDTIFNTIQEGIVVMSPDLEMEYVNSAANELLGLPDNIIGEKINRFLKEIDWKALLMMDFDAWEGFSRQEIEVFYPQQRTLNFYLLPQQDESGNAIEKIVLVLHDITEIRQEAKSVKESELLQAMTMLAAGVAHEIG